VPAGGVLAVSERSSLVSQYFYCEACRDVFEDALRTLDFSQGGRGWARFSGSGDSGRIVVAFLGGLYGGESHNEVRWALEAVADRFCHPTTCAVIDASNGLMGFYVAHGEVLDL
jgi:hypothetical protein